MTFVRNHAKTIMACDFFVVVTTTFRVLCVFVLMEVGTRRIVHHNVTAHPTAEWTLQQFREAIPGDHEYRFVIHDRDRIYSKDLDQAVEAMGVRILRTPVRSPKGKLFLRADGAHDPARVSGFRDSAFRKPPEAHPRWVGRALQPRSSAQKSWAGDSDAHSPTCDAISASPSDSRRLPYYYEIRARRSPTRVFSGKVGSVTPGENICALQA